MPKRKPLGKVELELLQAVEDLQPVTVRALVEHLADKTGQARTTILTTLERLRAKGCLTRRSINGVNHYSPRVSVSELLPRIVDDFVQKMLGGSVSPFVAYLQGQKEVDPDELAQLKSLVEELETKQAKKDTRRKK
ncbi:BlaI/MecI/CopY family transcriptional regulator [Bremerella cremea]|uniref:BlaI/MecI/CopY family transcriptional regulator n=1 Tax=Bremerella cremea TaxID=1031537 RepID=A0A368KRC8_9BACT|nr:BlaI/MecI/CopY family transcriptional regulator [Bremerella cremea]RCS49361.1 BlaI/MecI/CopY family transcriptional regulator [Bremerella cremea]